MKLKKRNSINTTNSNWIFVGRKRDGKSNDGCVGNEDEILLEAEEYCANSTNYEGEFIYSQFLLCFFFQLRRYEFLDITSVSYLYDGMVYGGVIVDLSNPNFNFRCRTTT